MSDLTPYDALASPRSRLAGATRPSGNPRLHAGSKPYSRPEHAPNGGPPNGSALPDSPVVRNASPSKRPRSIHQQAALPRSGSEPSGLISSFRSILSRPLAWLATPSKQLSNPAAPASSSKRGAGAGDPEDPDSPLDQRQGKRVRRVSPEKTGDYAPVVQRESRGGYELPSLPANIILSRSRQTSRTPDLGGTLSGSRSMPYLDPPSSALSPVVKRKTGHGPLTRSKRMEITGFGDEPEASDFGPVAVPETPRTRSRLVKGKQPDVPFPESTLLRSPTPSKRPATRDFALPSISPFRPPPPPSPHHDRQSITISPSFPTFGGVHRSQTMGSGVRAPSVVSDVSMTPRSVRRTGSVQFPAVLGRDEAMSVDVHHADWSMRSRAPSTPGFRSGTSRFGSTDPGFGSATKRGPLVWDPDKGFMRENEALQAGERPSSRKRNSAIAGLAQPAKQPTHKNDAERILFALESMRSTPLADARKTAPSTSQNLVGASSRALRTAINVPLSTSQAEEGQRSRHARERLGETPVSTMISPYGRRRQQDKVNRDARRDRTAEMEEESDYRPTTSPQPSSCKSRSRSERASRSTSGGEMSVDREPTPTPTPQPTPRRSTRIRHRDASVEPEQETPRAQRTSRKAGASRKSREPSAEPPAAKDTPRRKRRTTAEKNASTSPPPTGSVSAAPAVPTIMETAPSPSAESRTSSGYAPLADGSSRSNASSLRAKSSHSKRVHEGAASLNSSREPSPSEGRYSAKEEDLPDMDALEGSKISVQSFTGFKFGDFGASSPAPQTSVANSEPASKALSPSLAVPSGSGSPAQSRLSSGPLARLSSSRPRASSPLANNSVVAARDSDTEDSPRKAEIAPANPASGKEPNGFTPFSFSRSGTAAPADPPPLFSSLTVPKPAAEPAKKSLGFGIGKPPAEDKAATDKPGFSFTTSAPTPPPAAPMFDFGLPKITSGTSTPTPPAASSSFSFGLKPAESTKPAEVSTPSGSGTATPIFNFGIPKTDAAVPSAGGSGGLSFGTASKRSDGDKDGDDDERPRKQPFSFASAESATPAAKPAFSFGAPAANPPGQTSDTSKPFSFGLPSAATPSQNTTSDSKKRALGFDTQAAADKDGATKSGFSFGSASSAGSKPDNASNASSAFGAPTIAAPGSATTKAAPGFSFGAPSSTTEKKEESKSTVSFGATSAAPAAPQAKPASTGFSFGSSPAGAAAGGKETSNSLGLSSASPGSGAFSFGDIAAKPTTPSAATSTTEFNFGGGSQPKAAESNSNPFGSSQANGTASTAFSFGSTASSPNPGGTATFGAPAAGSNGFSSGTPAFGSQAQQTPGSTGGFSFGSSGNPSSNATGGSTGFGAINTGAFGSSANTSNGFGSQAAAPPASPFGAPSNAATNSNGGFSFNSAPAATPNAQTGGFGASTTPGATSGQQPFAFTFGPTASAPSPAASGTPFTFGAPSSQPSTPTGTTPAAFSFGAPAQPNGNQPNSATPFQFGQPQPPSAGTTSTPFQFGAAPADGQPGFSPGLPPPTTPGSPHGRKIAGKPRRRGALGK